MVKIIDHLQTGNRKFIRGGGRKRDIPLELLDDSKNKKEIVADNLIDKFSAKEIEEQKTAIVESKKKVKVPKIKKVKVSKIVRSLKKTTGLANSMKFEKLDKDKLNKAFETIKTIIEKHPHVRT